MGSGKHPQMQGGGNRQPKGNNSNGEGKERINTEHRRARGESVTSLKR
jgi:hypothetical protein